MSNNNSEKSRRAVLSSIGSIGVLSTTVGADQSDRAEEERQARRAMRQPNRGGEPLVAEDSGSMKLDPDDALSDRELDEQLESARAEYGEREAVAMAPPHKQSSLSKETEEGTVQIQSADPDQIDVRNFDEIHTWKDTKTVYASETGAYMGKVKQMATVYEGQETTDSGENIYAIWHMMRAEDRSKWLSVKTTDLSNGVDLPYGYSLHSYDPHETIDHGSGIDIGLEWDNGTLFIEDTFTLGDGEVAPSFGTTTGNGGEFAVEFDGCNKGTTLINGLCMITSDRDFSEYLFDWNWSYRMTTTTYCV